MNYPKLIKQIIDAANELEEEVDDLRIELGHANAKIEALEERIYQQNEELKELRQIANRFL